MRKGNIVHLVKSYPASPYNPVAGSEFECNGIIVDLQPALENKKGFKPINQTHKICCVIWEHGTFNTYKETELRTVYNKFKFKSKDKCEVPTVYGFKMPSTNGMNQCRKCKQYHIDPGAYCYLCLQTLPVCQACGEITDINEDGLCSNCSQQTIRNYGFKPKPVFKGTGPLFVGFELEVSVETEHKNAAKTIMNLCDNLVYCKSDSSVNNGFEIVSHPFDENYFNKFLWEETLFKALEKVKAKKHDSCGMHVHLSKSAFKNNLHLFKLLTFFNQSQGFLEKIAERSNNRYAALDPISKDEVLNLTRKTAGGRRGGLNLGPEHTVEIRIFANTVTPTIFRKNLEFVFAIFEFTSLYGTHQMYETNFLQFLNNSKKYNNLKNFLRL